MEFNGSSGVPVLTASNVSTSGGGTVVFESSGTLGASGGQIMLNGLNGSPITGNLGFMGGAYVAGNVIDVSGNSRNNYTWAKYSTTTGVAAFSSSDYSSFSNTPGSWSNTGTDNIDLTTNSLALSQSQSINSLRFDTNVSAFSLNNLQLNVAAMMSANNVTISSGVISTTNAALYIHNNEGMTIGSQLTGNFNLVITEDEPGQNSGFSLTNTLNNFVGSIYINNAYATYSADNRWGPTTNVMYLDGATLVGSSNPTVNRPIVILGGGAILSSGGNMTFAGPISGSGNINFPNSETVTLSSGGNSFSGVVTLQGPDGTSSDSSSSVVRTAAANVLGNNAAIVLQDDALLDLTNNGVSPGFNQTIGSLEDSGDIKLGSATITVGSRNAESVYLGTIYGTGGVTKTGSALWIIGNVQQYTGATNITGGTLQLYTGGGAVQQRP